MNISNKKLKVAFIFNVITFVFMIFAVVAMFCGFQFMAEDTTLSEGGYNAFQFFTVDSNILAGLICGYVAFEELLVLIGKKEVLPKYVYILKLIGTVGVTLTLLVVVFFLAPTMGDLLMLFTNSNLFLHAVNPILCIVSFIFFENGEKLNIKHAILGIIPMFLYSIYYSINVLTHSVNGEVASKYDFYGFLFGKTINAVFMLPLIYLFTFGISFLLVTLNKLKINKK